MGEPAECQTLFAQPAPPGAPQPLPEAKNGESRNGHVESEPEAKWTFILILAGVVTVFGSSLPVGYNIGVVNTPAEIIKQFCNESLMSRYDARLEASSLDILWSTIVSIFIIGGVTGSCLGATVADNIGRKGGAILANLLSLLAAILFVCSRPANSVELLLLARLLIGLSGGLTTSIIPMYLTEISPLKLRGSMGVLCPLGVTFGVLVGQLMGLDALLGSPNDWHYLLGAYGILVIIFTPCLLMLPESPKYLYVVKDCPEAAVIALSRIRNEAKTRLAADLRTLQEEAQCEQEGRSSGEAWGLLRLLGARDLRRAALLVALMQAGQQTSGINAVFYYSTKIFKSAGMSDRAAQLATIGAGVVNCVMAVVAVPLMAHCGRRRLALLSTVAATACLLTLGGAIKFIDAAAWMPALCILAVLLYVLVYGLGLGPIPYFIGSELFEVGPRPAAMALGSFSNWAGNFLVGMTFLPLEAAIGAYSFLLFATSTGALFLFIRRYLPETKGRSPADIAEACRRRPAHTLNP